MPYAKEIGMEFGMAAWNLVDSDAEDLLDEVKEIFGGDDKEEESGDLKPDNYAQGTVEVAEQSAEDEAWNMKTGDEEKMKFLADHIARLQKELDEEKSTRFALNKELADIKIANEADPIEREKMKRRKDKKVRVQMEAQRLKDNERLKMVAIEVGKSVCIVGLNQVPKLVGLDLKMIGLDLK